MQVTMGLCNIRGAAVLIERTEEECSMEEENI